MSQNQQQNSSKRMKCLIKQSSLMLEKYKNQDQIFKQPSIQPSFKKSSHNKSNNYENKNISNGEQFTEKNRIYTEYNANLPNEIFYKQQDTSSYIYQQQQLINQQQTHLNQYTEDHRAPFFKRNKLISEIPIQFQNKNESYKNQNDTSSTNNDNSQNNSNSIQNNNEMSQNNKDSSQNNIEVSSSNNESSNISLKQKVLYQFKKRQSSPTIYSQQVNSVRQNCLPQKLTEKERQQKLQSINQAIEQDRLMSKLQKIAEEKKVMKIISNKITRNTEEVRNVQNNSNQQNQRSRFIHQASNSLQNSLQNSFINMNSKSSLQFQDTNCSQFNQGMHNNQSITPFKKTYNFKTASKNCLEVMKEALEKRQKILEKSVPYYARAAKDMNNLLSQDMSGVQYFQSNQPILQQTIKSNKHKYLFQQQAEMTRPMSSLIGNQSMRIQSKEITTPASLSEMQWKSLSLKSMRQNSMESQLKPYYINNRLISNDANVSNYQQQQHTSSNAYEDKYHKTQDNTAHLFTDINISYNKLKGTKKQFKTVLDNNINQNLIKTLFLPSKASYKLQQHSTQSNSNTLQRSVSTTTHYAQHNSKDTNQKKINNKNIKQQQPDDYDYYGPWDNPKTDTNLNCSFN